MKDWNVIATAREHGFRQALHFLKRFGPVARTDYFNVLVLKVEDIPGFLQKISEEAEKDPGILGSMISRLVPLEKCFTFQSPEEFEKKAAELLLGWVDST